MLIRCGQTRNPHIRTYVLLLPATLLRSLPPVLPCTGSSSSFHLNHHPSPSPSPHIFSTPRTTLALLFSTTFRRNRDRSLRYCDHLQHNTPALSLDRFLRTFDGFHEKLRLSGHPRVDGSRSPGAQHRRSALHDQQQRCLEYSR